MERASCRTGGSPLKPFLAEGARAGKVRSVLSSRCITGVGEPKFRKAIQFLKDRRTSASPEDLRVKLTGKFESYSSPDRGRPHRILAPHGPVLVLSRLPRRSQKHVTLVACHFASI